MTGVDVRVTFPQYAAKFERIEIDTSIILVVRCPLCEGEVTRTTYAIPMSYKEVLKAKAADRETYWNHLTKQHPEHFDENTGS